MAFDRFAGDGAPSSVYRSTETYRDRFPGSHETGEVLTMTTPSLPEILARHAIDVRSARRGMLSIDVQGHELEVLREMGEAVKEFAQVSTSAASW
ncbi:FkbM family methyltransferase [Phaeobacter marinintestinus]|uniref:FkbM family methyltransferase n=1 Tax=Falsiphaeobacter marinintestinus TaxID=1492905 RepID=UPI00319DB00E